MQDFELPKPIPNLLVLIALTSAVLFGWLAGHIMRFSIPVYQFQGIPTPEFDLHIKNGYEFEFQGIRRLVVLTENPAVKVFTDTGTLSLEGISSSNAWGPPTIHPCPPSATTRMEN